ncbi:unnamed protein product [Prorocentrum cordatum]|uniref:non-specific serine/threonine protein kinase n=1 Tax=Prorocentrum cordatum TaxID=2364126 RepID=A0ABN9Y2Y7_9DINO|nr:unnamed protein product [Polarella glacialis]
MCGRYRRFHVVGQGSFGCCWLVESERREKCILKQIDVSRMSHPQREEAANEVRVLSRLRHPFIIGYKESFVEEGMLCIVTEYAEHGDLYRFIHDRKIQGQLLEESLVMRWFTQIALALKHMHDRRILHRDLKTQNIFLVGLREGIAKIGDFGIARVLQHTMDCALTAIGTPYYLSPEVCQEKPYNQKSDVWSLGCVLYELATLQHAFDADSMRGLVMKILRGVPPQVPLSFSAEVRELVPDMLVKDPGARPSINQVLQRPLVRQVIRQLLEEIEHRPAASAMGQSETLASAAVTRLPQEATQAPPPAVATGPAQGAQQAGCDSAVPLGRPAGDPAHALAAWGPSEAGPLPVLDHTMDGRHLKEERTLEPSGWAQPGPLHQLGQSQRQLRASGTPAADRTQLPAPPPQGEGGPRWSPQLGASAERAEGVGTSRCGAGNPRRTLGAAELQGEHAATGALEGAPQERSPHGGVAGPAAIWNGRGRGDGGGMGPWGAAVAPGGDHAAPGRAASAPDAPLQPQDHWALLSTTLSELGGSGLLPPPGGPARAVPCAMGEAGRAAALPGSAENAASSGSSAGTKATKLETEPELAGAGGPPYDFRGPDGAQVELPVGERDSLCYRVEALRVYIERELGIDDFLYAYQYLNESVLSEGVVDRGTPLEEVISSKAIGFMPLIHQLIVCEDQCFGQ